MANTLQLMQFYSGNRMEINGFFSSSRVVEQGPPLFSISSIHAPRRDQSGIHNILAFMGMQQDSFQQQQTVRPLSYAEP